MTRTTGGTGARVRVRVRPGASRTEVAGFWNGAWVVRIATPPEKGRANQALLGFLAGVLDLRRREVTLVAGERNRDKIIEVMGLTGEEVDRRLGAVTRDMGVPGSAQDS